MNDLICSLWDKKIIKRSILILLSVLALISVIQGIRNGVVYSQDFQWDAAKALALHIDPYDESLSPSKALDTEGLKEFYDYYKGIDAVQKMEANQFPSLLILLVPMTLLPPVTARLVWIVLNILFLLGIVYLLRKTFFKDTDKEIFAALILLMLAGTPLRNHLGVGQHTIFSVFFFLLAVYLSERNKTVLSAAALAVSYFKYTLTAILALYFIYKRKYKEFAISIGIHIILTIVSAFWLNESVIDMIIKPLKVSSALSAEGGLDFGALFGGSGFAFVLAFLVMVILFAGALMLNEGCENEYFSILVMWSLILLYHRTYDFFVIIFAAAFVLSAKCPAYIKYIYALTVVCVFFVLRIFSESLMSRVAVGTLYYCLTIIMTVFIFRNDLKIIRREGKVKK